MNNTGRYLTVSDNIGSIYVYCGKHDNSNNTFNYTKTYSLHVSTESIENILYTATSSQQHGEEETNLILLSDDNILNYIDLSSLDHNKMKRQPTLNDDSVDSIENLKSKFKRIFFGTDHCLLTFDESDESVCVSYESLKHAENNNELSVVKFQDSKDLHIGVFMKYDRAFLGSTGRHLCAWDATSGLKLKSIFEFDGKENILYLTRNDEDTLVHVLTNHRQLIVHTGGQQISLFHSILFKQVPNSPFTNYLKQSSQFDLNYRIKCYFTKDSSHVIIQFPEIPLVNGSNEIIKQSKLNQLCAFNIRKQFFTNYCIDGTLKSTQSGRYEPIKTLNSFCANQSEVLCICKGNMLIWNVMNETNEFSHETTKSSRNKGERVIPRDEPQSNMALFGSIPNFLTFLKHSIRLYDDFPGLTEMIQSEITASTSTQNGSIIITGDQYGNIIFWYRTTKTDNTFKNVTTYQNQQYGYLSVKEHSSEVS